MQRIKKSYSVRLNPVRVYYDDLEKVVECIREVSSKVGFSSDEYTFDSLEDLISVKKEKMCTLSIVGNSPYISVELKRDGASVYVEEDSPALRACLKKLFCVVNAPCAERC
jgi:hypothetical protein